MDLDRKEFLKYCLSAGLIISSPLSGALKLLQNDPRLSAFISRIGNTNDDKERVKLIEQLLTLDITGQEKEILSKILDVADRWANGFEKYARPGSEGNEWEGYLCGFFFSTCTLEKSILPKLDENDIFFPLIAFYRSRMLVAQLIQSGNIINVPDVRDKYLAESKRLMTIVSSAYKNNELAKNYLGIFKPWDEIVIYNPAAPAWANYQRMLMEKLIWMIHWWVDNRQISDGQFGGGWGDDVEMWRSWVPVLFAFDDEKATKSQAKLFEGLYGLSRMQKGYTTIMSDVEHTSEEYSDPLSCMLIMQPENPVWEKRALKVFTFIEDLWTGINERGQLQFKSTWFNVEQVHPNSDYACDTPYHVRMVQPLMLLWLQKGNARIGEFVTRWLKTWVNATFTSENGKPEGIIPAAIHWPDGRPAGPGKNWWEPDNHNEPTLYYFPTQQSAMYDCFLQAYYLTKDESFLKPVRFVSDKRLQGIGDGDEKSYIPGTLEWSLSVLKGLLPTILIKYRLITGDKSYDRIILKDARGYDRYMFDNDVNKLSSELDRQRMFFSLPREFYTSEVRWTDRLFSSVRYFNLIRSESLPGFNSSLLFSSLTGSVGNHGIFPVFGVKWITPPTEIAILTEVNSKDMFRAQLFHFGESPRKMKARLLNLQAGRYRWKLANGKKQTFELNTTNNEIEITVPPQKVTIFTVEMITRKS